MMDEPGDESAQVILFNSSQACNIKGQYMGLSSV
jgi:hypothetical protein